MDSPTGTLTTTGSGPSSNEENPRVKFLCSFSGSILPRPQDGKLRYVGGETRILSVPRDISYEELMVKMRELFDGVTVLKYQQPDEDLDALVSVVNDDDVTNMMEEYEKLGAGDGFTRLRLFLFSHPDQDGSMHFVDGDERDNERRYVDALNSLNESPNFRKQPFSDSLLMGPIDDINVTEEYLNQISLEGSVHNQRNFDMHMPHINLRHLTIPQMGSGQHQLSVSQRYNDMEAPWSPIYYSPGHPGHHDPRPAAEFPASPSSAGHPTPFGELSDRTFDRIPEDYSLHQVNNQYDYLPQFSDKVAFFSGGPVSADKAGFPGNILQGPSIFEGNNVCENCRMTFQRNQAYSDSPWKHGEQPRLESSNVGSVFHQPANPCADCHSNREIYMLHTDASMQQPLYREQNNSRTLHNEAQERGWVFQQNSNLRVDKPVPQLSGTGRLMDHYVVNGNGIPAPAAHGNLSNGHHVPSHYAHHEDVRYPCVGHELGNQVFNDQNVTSGSQIHTHTPPPEECGVLYGNVTYAYGADNLYQFSRARTPPNAIWRNVHNPVHGAQSYETSSSHLLANGSVGAGFIRCALESSPRIRLGVENQNPWVDSSQYMMGSEGAAVPKYSHGNAPQLVPNTCCHENQHLPTPEPQPSPAELLNHLTPVEPILNSDVASKVVDYKVVPLTTSGPEASNDTDLTESERLVQQSSHGGEETNHEANMPSISALVKSENPDDIGSPEAINSNSSKPVEERNGGVKSIENHALAPLDSEQLLDRIVTENKGELEGLGVKIDDDENSASVIEHNAAAKEAQNDRESVEAHEDCEFGSDNDNSNDIKIEPTKAEAEAIDRGLQTIKNEDLEEIRELGSGTYGAVYHGKWKGSDVAIKRIKASCFAGRPSERERLIADFWKEALILSSLHHPNVVSFYGVVRDGPDGSLATVTEFMINGSLKQFLQKKDRTIDRRKRLMIAMDAAFGMEYLHGKNIVHFDLKCENLLVNMRDPHRPVCKIGDLGLSKVKQHTLVSGGVRGTLPWMAPELLSGKSNMVTEKIDVYSFGIVMWEVLTGDEPYSDMHCASIVGGIVNNTLRPKIPTWCDPEWKALMESCWASDPGERPSFSEISQRLRNMSASLNPK